MKLLKTSWKIVKVSLITLLILMALAISATFLFQDKIIQITFSELNKHLATKIEIDPEVELSILHKFPEISIQLKEVQVYESFPESKGKLASLNKLFFTFNAFDFLKGKYVINNIYAEGGDIRLAIDSLGHGNYFIFKADTSAESNVAFDLKKIVLSDILLQYDNKALHQKHDVYIDETSSNLKVSDKVWHIGLRGDLFIHSIQIEGNEYFKEKKVTLNCTQEFHESTQLFRIAPSHLHVEGAEYSISGYYEGENKTIDLNLKAEKSSIANLISLLPKNTGAVFKHYKSSGNIFFEAKIAGHISSHESPGVKVNFGFSNASFFHPDLDKKIERATLSGSFSNGKHHNLRSSTLHLSNINAFFDGKNFKGNFSLENFQDPFIRFDCVGSADINSLLKFYPSKSIESASGTIAMDVSFSGKASDLKTSEGKERINGSGNILLQNVSFYSATQKINYKNINGKLSFNKNDLIVEDLKGEIGKSDFSMKGVFRHFINKLLLDKHDLTVEAELKSNSLDLNELLTAFSTPGSSTEPQGKRYPYLEDYNLKLKCSIGSLKYHRLHARQITGDIEFDQPSALLKNISLTTAGGKIKLNSLIQFKSKEVIELNTRADVSSIYIDSVFYIAENFSQEFIQDKNLKGQLTGSVRLFFAMNSDLEIHTPSLIATIDASIINGELNNFEPMRKLSRFVDVNELENIRFSELRNKIYIENRVVVIPEMEIKSNISNISIMGTHTFDQEMDYKLKVPLKNFKKKHTDKEEALGAIEEDSKGHSVVFLTIKGTSENYKVAYDTKRTGQKIKEDLKHEKKELENIFRKKKEEHVEQMANPEEAEFFDF